MKIEHSYEEASDQLKELVSNVKCRDKHRWSYIFENGYGASIILGPFTYGQEEGKFELAVMHRDVLCYDSGITEDVEGHLTFHQVVELLDRIKKLPVREEVINA